MAERQNSFNNKYKITVDNEDGEKNKVCSCTFFLVIIVYNISKPHLSFYSPRLVNSIKYFL